MTEPARMVPIEEAIDIAEMDEANAWESVHRNEPGCSEMYSAAVDRLARLRALAASGTTEVPG